MVVFVSAFLGQRFVSRPPSQEGKLFFNRHGRIEL
jgi:hypothetical protein